MPPSADVAQPLDRSGFAPFVAGRFAAPNTDLPPVAPSWGGAPLPPCRDASADEVESALSSAVAVAPRLAALARGERAALLRAFLAEIDRRGEELAATIVAEVGKPIALARLEVARAKTTARLGAEEASRFGGELVPVDGDASLGGALAFTGRFPAGPVLALTPFNFPLNLLLHKLVPAFAAGCPVVAKPSPRAPRTALLVAEAAAAAGWPAGSLSVLPLPNEAVFPLAADPRLSVVSFTGSAEVGHRLAAALPRRRVLLELGGNAALVVDETADLAKAASAAALGAMAYAGQVCISVQRIFVVQELFGRFRTLLEGEVRSLPSGRDPFDPSIRVGPMIDEASARRVDSWIDDAIAGGGRPLVRGRRDGTFLEPTLLTNVAPDAAVSCEEAFGPVAIVEPVADFDEALARVNDSRYGLQAGIFTTRIDRAKRAFEALRVGAVIVGDAPTFRFDGMPYGGVKDSGEGREGIRWAMAEMTEERLLVLR